MNLRGRIGTDFVEKRFSLVAERARRLRVNDNGVGLDLSLDVGLNRISLAITSHCKADWADHSISLATHGILKHHISLFY